MKKKIKRTDREPDARRPIDTDETPTRPIPIPPELRPGRAGAERPQKPERGR